MLRQLNEYMLHLMEEAKTMQASRPQKFSYYQGQYDTANRITGYLSNYPDIHTAKEIAVIIPTLSLPDIEALSMMLYNQGQKIKRAAREALETPAE